MKSKLPITAWLLAILAGTAVQPLAQAQTPDDLAALKADYKRPAPKPVADQALVELGRLLFWDPRSSASGTTACATCHFPYLGWSVTDREAATIPAS
jgi:cytochrome c peroxidase